MYKIEEAEIGNKKRRAILLLAEGKHISEIASELGVDRSTIYRWRTHDAKFMAELNRLRESMWDASQAKLLAARGAALDAAMELLTHEDARIRTKAIETILRRDVRLSRGPISIGVATERVAINKRR